MVEHNAPDPDTQRRLNNYKKPDCILKARHECALSFLEEGLLPKVKDTELLDKNEVFTMAATFIKKHQEKDPTNFDITDPTDLIIITGYLQNHLIIMLDPEDETCKLIQKSCVVLLKALDVTSDPCAS